MADFPAIQTDRQQSANRQAWNRSDERVFRATMLLYAVSFVFWALAGLFLANTVRVLFVEVPPVSAGFNFAASLCSLFFAAMLRGLAVLILEVHQVATRG